MPYFGQQSPVTAQHFLTYRDDMVSAADGTFWVPRIPLPILLLRDQADGVVLPFEPYMLLSAAHAEGSLVEGITYTVIPDQHPVSAAGHIFTDNTEPLHRRGVGLARAAASLKRGARPWSGIASDRASTTGRRASRSSTSRRTMCHGATIPRIVSHNFESRNGCFPGRCISRTRRFRPAAEQAAHSQERDRARRPHDSPGSL